jgi:serine protease Do
MYVNKSNSGRSYAKFAWPVGFLLILVIGIAAATWTGRTSQTAAEAAPPADLAVLEALQAGLNWMADEVKPAVVFIEVEQSARKDDVVTEEYDIPERFRDFFGPGFPFPGPGRPPSGPQEPAMGQGSGVVIDPEGYILTNNHVVGSADKVTVHFPDGEAHPAEVVGADALSDLAVIKIESDRKLKAAKLGNADLSKVGSWVMAIGYPFGAARSSTSGIVGGRFDSALRFEPTVTVGVISAKDRQLQSDIPGRPYRDLIQTDAPINPGSSGGPLVNIKAEVVGINQAIFTSPIGGNIGVGFAVPIDENTKSVIEALKGGEPVVRGQLGVLVSPLTPTLKSVYEAEHGVFVEEVLPDTAASRGGLQAEDVILRYGGEKMTSVDQFVNAVLHTRPGKTVAVDVLRDGEAVSLEVTVETLSLEPVESKPKRAEGGRLGLTVETVPAGRAKEMGIAGGVLVRAVSPGGQGARAGMQSGDVIFRINRQEITDVAAYQSVVGELKKGDAVVIRAWRGDRKFTAQIERLEE